MLGGLAVPVEGRDYDGFVSSTVDPRYLNSAASPIGLLWVAYTWPLSDTRASQIDVSHGRHHEQAPGRRLGHHDKERKAKKERASETKERISEKKERTFETRPRTHSKPKYLADIYTSRMSARAACPSLPGALATDETEVDHSLFEHILGLNCTRYAQRWNSAYLVRIAALAASPFEMTLEVDASVAFCSPQLESALRFALEHTAVDFAVNFELSPLLPTEKQTQNSQVYFNAYRIVRPTRVEDFIPHCYAMLFRKGNPLTSLLRLWANELQERNEAQDQWQLGRVFARLRDADYATCLVWADGNSSSCAPVTVMRLSDAAVGFKAAAKAMERSSQPAHALAHAAALKKWKISTLGPRYTRPFEGHALLLHSCSELPDEQRAENTTKQQACCSFANGGEFRLRMVIQMNRVAPHMGPGQRLLLLYNQSQCRAETRAQLQLSHLAKVPDPTVNDQLPLVAVLCGMLPAVSAQPPATDQTPALLERFSTFWAFAKLAGLTDGDATTGHALDRWVQGEERLGKVKRKKNATSARALP